MRLGGARSQGTSAFKLQRKIFTRWVNQKLTKRGIVIDDIVNSIGDGNVLIALMEGMDRSSQQLSVPRRRLTTSTTLQWLPTNIFLFSAE